MNLQNKRLVVLPTFNMKKLLIAVLLALLPLTASARYHHPAPKPTPAPAPQPTPLLQPLQLGAFNLTVGTIQAAFDGWTDDATCFKNQTTFIYWENYGYSLDSIISGSQDANIRRFAGEICPNTILALFHEMNGNWDAWDGTVGSNTTAKVIAAYQHIHNIIGSKARYAWVVNNDSVPNVAGNQPSDYWPGASYVDVVGVDGFDWGGMTFSQAIAPAYGEVTGYGKPVWITSFGTTSSNQAAWLTNAIATAKSDGIGALIYFDANDGGSFKLNAAGVAAFRR